VIRIDLNRRSAILSHCSFAKRITSTAFVASRIAGHWVNYSRESECKSNFRMLYLFSRVYGRFLGDRSDATIWPKRICIEKEIANMITSTGSRIRFIATVENCRVEFNRSTTQLFRHTCRNWCRKCSVHPNCSNSILRVKPTRNRSIACIQAER
jgi:hypothetical protein